MDVVLRVERVGINFAIRGVVRERLASGQPGKMLATAPDVRPLTYEHAALEDAYAVARTVPDVGQIYGHVNS